MARHREFDEDRVILAIRDEFWDKGYAATSMDDLLRVSGLGKGSLYGAFGDKRSLFLRVLRDYDDANLLTLRERLESAARGIDLVREFVQGPRRRPDRSSCATRLPPGQQQRRARHQHSGRGSRSAPQLRRDHHHPHRGT